MKRNGDLRRTLRLRKGSRTARRRDTKVVDGSRTVGPHSHTRKRAAKPSVVIDKLEREVRT